MSDLVALALKDQQIVEQDVDNTLDDPEESRLYGRNLVTQPYDLVINSLLQQIRDGTLHLRPISDRPKFQRKYVWSDTIASKLIESILLSVPIPPCYLSQNSDYELDVIDGQQRIYSIFRFCDNQFSLRDLKVLTELNGLQYFKLPPSYQRKLNTYTLRCVIITNDSDSDIKFDVFERLNTNTVPLNPQELRNCIYRGTLIDTVNGLADDTLWLSILGRKAPDNRMNGEELILRFFAFQIQGPDNYRTPQKQWLNEVALDGRKLSESRCADLGSRFHNALANSTAIFETNECFRRLPLERARVVPNKALMDLTLWSLARVRRESIEPIRVEFRRRYESLLKNDEFSDLITRAIDHRTRTMRRFQLWQRDILDGIL